MPLTWEEAKSLLEEYRAYLIERGRYEAVRLAVANGTVNARQVRKVMKAAGLLHPDLDERWMGVVFSSKKLFDWTGEYIEVDEASPRSRGGGGGGRPIRVWRLQPDVTALRWPRDVPRPGLLEEALGPSQPTRDEFRDALSDIRVMQQTASAAGFKHKNKSAGIKLARWMRYMAEEGGS